MTTDLGPPILSVSPDEIAAHAGTVDALAARSDLCAAAVRYLRLDTAAYGQVCGFVPALLNEVTSTIDATSSDASRTLHATADGLRLLVPHFAAADDVAGRLGSGAPDAVDNPLIAPRIDSTTWFSGIGLYETFDQLIASVNDGSWIDVTLAGLGTAAEVVAWGLDPIGMLVAAGFGFAVEHVSVLSDALDWLAGDPDQVNANAQTWRNAAAEQFALAEEYRRSVEAELASWTGEAADTYRSRAAETADLLTALGKSYETMSVIIGGAGTLVAVVRTLVRDLIAQCVSLLLYRIPAWSAMEAGSLGLATPYVGAQVSALVARFSTKIAQLLHALVRSMSRLTTSARQLDDLIATIRGLLRRRWGAGGSLPQLTPSATHPNIYFGPLGKDFKPGVVETNYKFRPKERSIGQYFADRGVRVESVKPVDNVNDFKNPDSVFRWSPDDPGRLTELKALASPNSSAVRHNITEAGSQLGPHGGGDVVIDGRNVGLTEAEARRGYARTVGQTAQHQTYMPDTVYIILGDGTLLTLPDR
ncbi:MAG: hypothetical protein IRY85_02130 [Micromonosporaceae bacterium]|nr:hypothetical protein [Micromonosporaceae bacterium]